MAQHGFKQIVPELIKKHPGLTAEEYASLALEQGLSKSDSKNPVFSLSTTLRKEYREHRMLSIRAEKNGGKLRFYPIDHPSYSKDGLNKPNIPISVSLPPIENEIVDILVETGKFKNKNDALLWLVAEGIRAKDIELKQAKKIVNQIRELKNSVKI